MTQAEIMAAQLEQIAAQIRLEYTSLIMACATFVLFLLSVPFVIMNCRRVALGIQAVACLAAFLVPIPLTYFAAPPAFLICLFGLIVVTVQEKRKRTSVPLPQHQATLSA